jgi:SAM-dependent MidA family methyltransferase
MRLALYCPVYGYYEKEEDKIGRKGDFYTSVSVGNLFGELLAFQFADWLAACQSETRPVQIVEAGAHRGHLARDILIWLREHRPNLFQRLQYAIVEPSAVRQKWQSATLSEFAGKVIWLSRIMDHASGFKGIIFANELLDSMPVRRFGWNAQKKEWFEWGVTLSDGKLAWTSFVNTLGETSPDCSSRRKEALIDPGPMQQSKMEPPYAGCYEVCEGPGQRSRKTISSPFERDQNLAAVLPNGFIFESCPEAEAWWQDAARALERGKLMTIDYGLTADELISPERKDGTLRGYYRHHATSELLAHPGKQDLTAHVNFSALIEIGEANGLNTEKFETQSQFLTKIAMEAWIGESAHQPNASRARQFQTLTHPEHLGRSFRVLVQSRNQRA